MADESRPSLSLARLIALIASSTSAALGVLKLAGGTMSGDIVSSTGTSLNTTLAYVWRGLAPVVRTYTAFGLGAAAGTVVTPSWGGKSYLCTGATANRISGMFTPVNQSTWAATHLMRVWCTLNGDATIGGAAVKISGGGDIYVWTYGTAANTITRGHESGAAFTALVLVTLQATGKNVGDDWRIVVPSRASEATAGVVTVARSGDGFATVQTIDSVSLAVEGTGVAGAGISATAQNGAITIPAELWS